MSEESTPATTTNAGTRRALPWILLVVWLAWIGFLASQGLKDIGRTRANHERERQVAPDLNSIEKSQP